MAAILEVSGLKKTYKNFELKNVSFSIYEDCITGFIGVNGAGKTTTINALLNLVHRDGGIIKFRGKDISTDEKTFKDKIGVVFDSGCFYDELTIKDMTALLAPAYSEWDNHTYTQYLERFSLQQEQTIGTLSKGMKMKYALALALSHNAELLIMDEPTSSLGEKEVEQLMKTCRELKARGIGIVFVSHKLEELFELCDRVTVIRDGEYIETRDISGWDNDSLITAMVGRSLDNQFPKEIGVKSAEPMLKVEHLKETGVLKDVSFEAYGGQILGFAGLVGAGRTETMRAIFGADPIDGGTIEIKGKQVHIKTPRQAIQHGIAFLTEDRKGQGLVLAQSIRTNLILANMKGFSTGMFLNEKRIEDAGQKNIASLRIKTPSIDEIVGQLSGGNQQKVVIGKWVNTDADIFIFDEPTRGIDVGAKVEVYNVMNSLVKQGKCVIMVSSEMPEILGMSDRVIVMRGGEVMATVDRDSEHFNQEDLMKAAWGGKLDD